MTNSVAVLLLLFLANTILNASPSTTPNLRNLGQDLQVGGYSDVPDLFDPFLTAAATRAVYEVVNTVDENSHQFTFNPLDDANVHFQVMEAQQQVVAGMNYKMLIQLKDNEDTCLGAFWVTVYDQFGERRVSEWGDEVLCSDLNLPEHANKEINDDYYNYVLDSGDNLEELTRSDAYYGDDYFQDDYDLQDDYDYEGRRRLESIDQVQLWSVCGLDEVSAFAKCGTDPTHAVDLCATDADCPGERCLKVCIHEPEASLGEINFCYLKQGSMCTDMVCMSDSDCTDPNHGGCGSMETCTHQGICCTMVN